MSDRHIQHIATHRFSRIKADGTVVEWQQEDESAVTSKTEAVGMVQRTIDFWLPALVDDLQRLRGFPRVVAMQMAHQSFEQTVDESLSSPFAKRWQLSREDFTFPDSE
jgi:hypothetical protein